MGDEGTLGGPASPAPEIKATLCIPGPWPHVEPFENASDSEGIVVRYPHLRDRTTGEGVQFDLLPPDARMTEAFRTLSGGLLADEDLERIQRHASVLVLFGDGGSLDRLRPLVELSLRYLRLGGAAVMVESAGKAHSAKEWAELLTNPSPVAYVQAFVTMVHDEAERVTCSCGMHNLGLRDARVKGIEAAEALELLARFNWYQATDRPTIRDGDRTRLSPNLRQFLIRAVPCTLYEAGHPNHNPIGIWELQPADGPAA
ncbi:MAG: hypothetical protein HYY18_18550 [Planctomycetes bacterium]|nr:hypothetical protein [Planctomycetota bacterium]